MQKTLLSMTAEEAVVADNVASFQRADVEAGIITLSERLKTSKSRAQEIQTELKKLQESISADTALLNFYHDLQVLFDKKFPKGDDSRADSSEEVPVSPPTERTKKRKV